MVPEEALPRSRVLSGSDPLHCRGNIPAFGCSFSFWIYLHEAPRPDTHDGACIHAVVYQD